MDHNANGESSTGDWYLTIANATGAVAMGSSYVPIHSDDPVPVDKLYPGTGSTLHEKGPGTHRS